MWIINENMISKTECSEIITEINRWGKIQKSDRHFVSEGKQFFATLGGLKVLKKLVRAARLANLVDTTCYVQHAFLLIKSEKAAKTPMHQDRPFWTKLEPDPSSMYTAWTALEDINENKGALCLNQKNKCDSPSNLNTQTEMFPHVSLSGKGNFNYIIEEKLARDLEKKLTVIPVKAGDTVVFDAYEPHMSSNQISETARLALKVVYSKSDSTKNMLSVRLLERLPVPFLWCYLRTKRITK